MEIEQILAEKPIVLSKQQRESYFENGYLLIENLVGNDWLEKLRNTISEMAKETATLTQSNSKWDIEPTHTAEKPRLRRLTSPADHHPLFWEFASNKIITDIVADLVGPDVKFHHSKLNFKWSDGGEEVKWHQDIQFYPHTNYNVLAVGTYLEDCDESQGPLCVIPGSHNRQLFNQYNEDGDWVGCLSDRDAQKLEIQKEVYLPGLAGSVTIHNCRTVHQTKANMSPKARPLLINSYSSADAMPYTADPVKSRYFGTIVRGKPAQWAHHDPRPCLMPPDWSNGYKSIFAHQKEVEENSTK